jgi:hypothetical protein
MQRVVKGVPATLTLPTSLKASAGTVTITRDRDASTIVSAAAVTVAAKSVSYTLAGQTYETNLTATWSLSTASGTVTVSEPVEVTSCEAVSVEEMRTRRPLDDVNRYPDATLIRAREALVSEMSDRAGVKFTGGEFTVTLDGTGNTELFLPVGKPRTITKIVVDGTTLSADELATILVDSRAGVLYYPTGWISGRLNVTVTGVSGFAQPPGGLAPALAKGVRHMLVDSPTSDRATSISNEDGTTQNLIVAGYSRGAVFAIPELNVLVEQQRNAFGVA